MKTTTVARGFLGAVASLLGVVAVGCSADGWDEASAGNGEIGSVEQALGGSNPVLQSQPTGLGNLDERIFAASCTILDGDQEKLVVAGGFLSNGNPSDDIFVYDPSTGVGGTWTHLESIDASDKLTTARGMLKGIRTASNKCVFLGGTTAETGAAAVKIVDELSVSGGVFQVTRRTDMNVARSNFAVSKCANNSRLIVFGGRSNTTELTSIEYAPNMAPVIGTDVWTSATDSLEIERYDFGFAQDGSNPNRYLISGGHTDSAATDATSETITTVDCEPTTTLQEDAGEILGTAVEGPALFFEGSSTNGNPNTAKFVLAGGRSASAAVAKAYELTVTWSNPPTLAVNDGATTDLSAATYLPVLVDLDASPVAHMLLGGSSGDFSPAADHDTFHANAIQEYQDTFSPWQVDDLTTNEGRLGGVAELVDGSVYFVTGAKVVDDVRTFLDTMDKIAP